MNRHVGASFTLSFSVVGFFAIALYQPEGTPTPPSRPPSASRPSPDGSLAAAPERPPTPVQDPSVRPTSARGTTDQAAARPVFAASAKAQPATRRRASLPPRSAFTQVGEGETLADVASRIYGSPEASRALWRANRDMIGSPDATLQVGMLLRTP